MATRIAVMHHGVVQQFDDPDTIYNRPANLFVARFMGSPPMNTLPARLAGIDGAPCAMIGEGADAIRLKLPLDANDGRLSGFKDSAVVLGIRPECIAESQRRFGDGASEPLLVDAMVDMVEPTGAETMVLMRLGGERVTARVAPDTRLPLGVPSRFAIDTRKLCLFDPRSELLIA